MLKHWAKGIQLNIDVYINENEFLELTDSNQEKIITRNITYQIIIFLILMLTIVLSKNYALGFT